MAERQPNGQGQERQEWIPAPQLPGGEPGKVR